MTRVLFLHIHKCGGSTLRHMLNEVYPHNLQFPVPIADSRKREVYRTSPVNVPRSMVKMQEAKLDTFQLYMGHYDWQVTAILPDDTITLTMLRDPIAQLYSHFRYFWVDTKHYGALKDRYEYSGFEGFLEGHDVERFSNQQTRFLSGRYWNYPPDGLSSGLVTYAKKNLRKCVYGLVERWDESIALFEETIGQSLPRNILENHNERYIAKPLDDSLRQRIAEVQSYDVSLYDYAVKHFEEQFNGSD